MNLIADHVRAVADFPKAGIMFRDLTPLLAHAEAFAATTKALAAVAGEFDVIAGVEARGFVFAAALAQHMSKGMVLVRKAGKLPGRIIAHEYALEYGVDRLEIHADCLSQGTRVLLVDDVLATGGTANAAVELLQKAGAVVERALFVIELEGLPGRERLEARGVEVHGLVNFPA